MRLSVSFALLLMIAWRAASFLVARSGRPKQNYGSIQRQGPLLLRRSSTTTDEVAVKRGTATKKTKTKKTKQSKKAASDAELFLELQLLSKEIAGHDAAYYSDSGSSPSISDGEYDALCLREAEICKAYPYLQLQLESAGVKTRYGGRVGTIVEQESSSRIKRTHLKPMLSLDNVFDTAQLLAWLARIRKKLSLQQTVTIITEPKLDGLSLSLYYERINDEFLLQCATTRGDGKTGQNVSVPGTVPVRLLGLSSFGTGLEVRGEVVLPRSVFQEHLASSSSVNTTKFASARNAASGILFRKNEAAETEEDTDDWRSKLVFYAYDLHAPTGDDMNYTDSRDLLQSLGFLVPMPCASTTLSVDGNNTWNETDSATMLQYYNSLRQHRELEGVSSENTDWGDYDMDGCVHKVSEPDIRNLLGTSNRAPRWAVAHKFPATLAVTTLQDILVQVGRTGALTPVAILEPVTIAGVTVQRATMNNFWHMQRIFGGDSVGRGQRVLVRRAGEVIPQVVSVLGELIDNNEIDSTKISLALPTTCPACGSKVLVDMSESSNKTDQVVRCSGPQLFCPPRAVSALQHAFSRDALDVSGLSDARIQSLMDATFLHLPCDIFSLDAEKVESIAQLDGWGEKSARNLVTAANRVATQGVSLSRFIFSLGIRFSGVHSSSLIAGLYGTVDAFLSDVETARNQDSTSFAVLRNKNESTKGIGPSLLAGLVAFSQEKELVEAARQLANKVVVHRDDTLLDSTSGNSGVSADGKPLFGLSVVFTGSVPGLSRSAAQEKAKQMGAKSTPSTVSKSVDLVVYGNNGGKKLKDALKLGIKVMDTSEFLILLQSLNDIITID
jgi:DNA ligase (NAD+)